MSPSVRFFSAAAVSVSLSISAQFIATIPPVAPALAGDDSYLVNAFAHGIFGNVILPQGMIGLASGIVAFALVLTYRGMSRWRLSGWRITILALLYSGATLWSLWDLGGMDGKDPLIPTAFPISLLLALTWFAIPALGAEIALTALSGLAKRRKMEAVDTATGRGEAGEVFPVESFDDCTHQKEGRPW